MGGGGGVRWSRMEVVSGPVVDNTVLVADSKDKLQKLVEEFGREWQRTKLKESGDALLSASGWGGD